MALFTVIGLGQLGVAVAVQLTEGGGEVIAIDRDAGRVEAIKDRVARAVILDATDERALRASGIADSTTVVLALVNQLEEAVLATMLLRDLGVGRIIARAGTDVQAKVLQRIGVSKVIFPERQAGVQLARQILTPSVREVVPLADGASLVEIEVPRSFVGKNLAELKLRAQYGVNAVALRRTHEVAEDDGTAHEAEAVVSNIGPETVVEKGDILVLVGTDVAVRGLAAVK